VTAENHGEMKRETNREMNQQRDSSSAIIDKAE
jgi:hypothetical protein